MNDASIGVKVQECGPLQLLASDYLLAVESAGHALCTG